MKRLDPFGDSIGQPSSAAVLSSLLFPPMSSIFCGSSQAENCLAAAGAAAAIATLTIAADMRVRAAQARADVGRESMIKLR
jgi:hypothetical protein